MVIDMTDVRHLGVSSSLSLEEAILDMIRAGRKVYIAGVHEQAYRRMRNLGLLEYIPEENFIESRVDALQMAAYGQDNEPKAKDSASATSDEIEADKPA